MAEGDGVIYNTFKELVMEAEYNLASGGDTIKLTLHTAYTPLIDTHLLWGTAGVSSTEYGTADGYTALGKTLAGQDVTMNTTSDRGEFDGTDVTWTALGALTPATPSHCILWDDTNTAPADPLIAYWVLGTTATNGGNYTIQWGTNGIILLT